MIEPQGKRDWNKLLSKKKDQTQAKYLRHYREFTNFFKFKYGEHLDSFSQSQLDNYSERFDNKESKSN